MSHSSTASSYSPHQMQRPHSMPQQQSRQRYNHHHHLSTPQSSLSPNTSAFQSPASILEHNFLPDQSPSFNTPSYPDLDLTVLDSISFRDADDPAPWNPLQAQNVAPSNVSFHNPFQSQPYYTDAVSNTPTHSAYVPSDYGDAYETPMTSLPPPSEIYGSELDQEQTFPVSHHGYSIDSGPQGVPMSDAGSVSTNGGTRKRAASDHPFKCDVCPHELRTESELKKHKARHEKSHTCPVPNCEHGKEGTGFTTSNDLERHMGSKHQIFLPGTKLSVFQCQAKGCEGKKKLWPRFDNFKQHIERMHTGANVDDIIARSRRAPALTAQSHHYHDLLQKREARNGTRVEQHLGSFHTQSYSQAPVRVGLSQSSPAVQVSKGSSILHTNPSGPRSGLGASISSASGHLMAPLQRRRSDAGLTRSSGPVPLTRHSRSATQAGLYGRPSIRQVNTNVALETPEILISPSTEEQYRCTTSQLYQEEVPLRNLKPEQVRALYTDSMSPTSGTSTSRKRSGADGDSTMTDCTTEKADSSPEAATGKYKCEANGCSKTFSRDCDLTKHRKRHDRPYGCTVDNCFKQFGSKNDWKRHENSQHYQNECWRCPLARYGKEVNGETPYKINATDQCAQIFHKEEDFAAHVESDHRKEWEKHKEDVNEWKEKLSTKSHIGANGQHSFWCGFCKEIKPLVNQELKAWDERFSHIGEHFNKGQHIESWLVCCAKRWTKGQEKIAVIGVPEDGTCESQTAVKGKPEQDSSTLYCASCGDGPVNIRQWTGQCLSCYSILDPIPL